MTVLLTKVRAQLEIPAFRPSFSQLEGAYRSAFHGQGLDFDDLREYATGDDARQIDWVASARMAQPVVKRYSSQRRKSVSIVMNTGREFDALAADGQVKRDVAISLAGIMGWVAVRHSDDVQLIAGDAAKTAESKRGSTAAHLESLLQNIAHPLHSAPGHVRNQLVWVSRFVRSKRILIVIADDAEFTAQDSHLIRRLAAQHEVFWITVADADVPTLAQGTGAPSDVASGATIVAELLGGTKLAQAFTAAEQQRAQIRERELTAAEIPQARIVSSKDLLHSLRSVLSRSSDEKR